MGAGGELWAAFLRRRSEKNLKKNERPKWSGETDKPLKSLDREGKRRAESPSEIYPGLPRLSKRALDFPTFTLGFSRFPRRPLEERSAIGGMLATLV
jgi:hypothetical protein